MEKWYFQLHKLNYNTVSRVDFSNEKFYSMMEAYDGLPLTSQFTAFEFQEVYEEMYRDGVTDVICVLINAQGSATYNNSIMAADNFYEDNPEAVGKIRFISIDGRSYTGAYIEQESASKT